MTDRKLDESAFGWLNKHGPGMAWVKAHQEELVDVFIYLWETDKEFERLCMQVVKLVTRILKRVVRTKQKWDKEGKPDDLDQIVRRARER